MRLKDIREDNDLTQKELAEKLHIKQNTLSQYESEQRQIPINLLIQLSVIFDTSVDYILEITDDAKPYKKSARIRKILSKTKD